MILLVAAFVAACLRLGWWQWQRYNSAGGTMQNLGYTLQWPTFAVFAIFLCWRLSRLEAERRRHTVEQDDGVAPEPASHTGGDPVIGRPPSPPDSVPRVRRPRRWPGLGAQSLLTGSAEDRLDAELAAYNRYLAELNAQARLHAKDGTRAR